MIHQQRQHISLTKNVQVRVFAFSLQLRQNIAFTFCLDFVQISHRVGLIVHFFKAAEMVQLWRHQSIIQVCKHCSILVLIYLLLLLGRLHLYSVQVAVCLIMNLAIKLIAKAILNLRAENKQTKFLLGGHHPLYIYLVDCYMQTRKTQLSWVMN